MLARMPRLFADAKPTLPPDVDDANAGPTAGGIGRAVGRCVVDDDDLVRSLGRRSLQGRKAPFKIRARVERHDDNRDCRSQRPCRCLASA